MFYVPCPHRLITTISFACCLLRWMKRSAEGVLRGPVGAIGNEPREGHQSGSGNCILILNPNAFLCRTKL